jgi:hypothetical protein
MHVWTQISLKSLEIEKSKANAGRQTSAPSLPARLYQLAGQLIARPVQHTLAGAQQAIHLPWALGNPMPESTFYPPVRE